MAEIQNLVLAFVDWNMRIRIIKQLSSFKTLGRVKSGCLKKFCIPSGHAKQYALRYNNTNVTIYP